MTLIPMIQKHFLCQKFVLLTLIFSTTLSQAEVTSSRRRGDRAVSVNRKISCLERFQNENNAVIEYWASDTNIQNFIDMMTESAQKLLEYDFSNFMAEINDTQTSPFSTSRPLSRCEKYQLLIERIREVKAAKVAVTEKINLNMTYKNVIDFYTKTPDFPETMRCVLDCSINSKDPNCSEDCNLGDNKHLRALANQDSGSQQNSGGAKCKTLSDKELQTIKRQYMEIVATFKKQDGKVTRSIDSVNSNLTKFKENLPQQIKHHERQAEKLGTIECKKQVGNYESLGRRVTKSLLHTKARGSGFFAQVGDDKLFLSAHHVAANINNEDTVHRLFPLHFLENNKKTDISFSTTANGYDRGRDVVSQRTTTPNPSLPLIESDKVPRVGQKFNVFGHPNSHNNDLTGYSCFFLGFYNRPNKVGSHYLLKCPSSNFSMHGASGGPLVDNKGKAWGVLTSGISGQKWILVSPISQNNGKLKTGTQEVRHVDNCYRGEQDKIERYSCSIYPTSNAESY